MKIERFARGIPHLSNLAFDPGGRLWVTSAGYLAAPADGVWIHVVPYATVSATGHTGRVVAFSGFDGRRFTQQRVVVDGLPTGRHRVDSLAAGPDGRLYLGVGSDFDARGPIEFCRARSWRSCRTARTCERGTRRRPRPTRPAGPALGAGRGGGRAALRAVRPQRLVTRYGSSFPDSPSGGDVVRVTLPRRGRSRVRRFATGFGLHDPLGLPLGPGGGLYVSRWSRGSIVRLVPR